MNTEERTHTVRGRLPPTEQLVAFKTVVELGGFTAAANELCITQSAISHQIARLERMLGSKLLRRSTRRLTLTGDGERLIAAIAEPLEQLQAAFEPIVRTGRGNVLKIQIEPVFAATWLAPRLEDFLDKYPHMRLEQYRAVDLRMADVVDLSIRWGHGSWPDMDCEPLLSLYYVPICSPALIASGKLQRSEDLSEFPLLHDRHHREWIRWYKLYGMAYPNSKTSHFVDDSHILIEMAVESRGIALMSPVLIRRELANGSLVCPFPDLRLDLKEAYHIVTRRGQKLSRSTQEFMAWLRLQAKD